jgi:nucleotide sugar dehydrogenase
MATKIGVIGMGHVGNSMCRLFRKHAEIVTYDARQDERYPAEALASCEFGVIAVDTPASDDGSCDISKVVDAVTRLPLDKILLKSTVPPGATDSLSAQTGKEICFSPEYFGESTYYEPSWPEGPESVPFMILGGPPGLRTYLIDRLLPALGPSKMYFQTTALEAEIIKYMENAYLATKVTFVNEFYNICRHYGADWHTVREGWLLDPRIGSSHSAVFASSKGFAGKCLPKDLRAIISATAGAGYSADFLLQVLASNERFRRSGVTD